MSEPATTAAREGRPSASTGWPSPPGTHQLALDEPTVVVRKSAHPATQPSHQHAFEAAPYLLADELAGCDPPAAERLQRGLAALPQVGDAFAGFRLVAALGRGAFGAVFLARQGELADRPVALKIAADMGGEMHSLAQLHHANIVPVYSAHRSGPLHALCMPYLGRTTLARVLNRLRSQPQPPTRGQALLDALDADDPPTQAGSPIRDLLRRSTYVEAVLWLGARLADGLAHAHERGILHRDLKPANVLLTDEGQPMLLDFNLAQDVKTRCVVAKVGGTLPYMAPEQMEAFQGGGGAPDARADLFALGVLLFQLLAERDPYPERNGAIRDVLPQLIEDRRRTPQLPPRPGITPCVAALVCKCLHADPARRYQSAADLRDDLERQRSHLPLKHAPNVSLKERFAKWAQRHPRLSSFTAVSTLAVVLSAALLAGFVARGQALAQARALDGLTTARADLHRAQFALVTRTGDPDQLRDGVAVARRVLNRYGVLEDSNWRDRSDYRWLPSDKQEQLRADLGEVLLLLARAAHLHAAVLGPDGGAERALQLARLAADVFPADQSPPTLWRLRAELAEKQGQLDEADQARSRAGAAPRSVRDFYLDGAENAVAGRCREALPLLQEATARDPGNFLAWFAQGYCHDLLAQHNDAVSCYTTCIALRPDFAPSRYNRGLARLWRNDASRQDGRLALADLDETLRLDPGMVDAYVNRAIARQRLNDPRGAVADLTLALERRPELLRAYFMRAQARRQIGDAAGATADEAEGLRREPSDEEGFLARGSFHLRSNPNAALADFDAVLSRNPRSFPAIRNKVHLLAERLNRLSDAVGLLDEALEAFPDSLLLRSGRAVYRARLGRREEALADLALCLRDDDSAQTEYKAACVYALNTAKHAEDRPEALRHFAAALRKGYDRFDVIEQDADIDALRSDPEFRRLLQAARSLGDKRSAR
jgi:serine/threonine protein kinase